MNTHLVSPLPNTSPLISLLTSEWVATFNDSYAVPYFQDAIAASSVEIVKTASNDVITLWQDWDGEVEWTPNTMFEEMVTEYAADTEAA